MSTEGYGDQGAFSTGLYDAFGKAVKYGYVVYVTGDLEVVIASDEDIEKAKHFIYMIMTQVNGQALRKPVYFYEVPL